MYNHSRLLPWRYPRTGSQPGAVVVKVITVPGNMQSQGEGLGLAQMSLPDEEEDRNERIPVILKRRKVHNI